MEEKSILGPLWAVIVSLWVWVPIYLANKCINWVTRWSYNSHIRENIHSIRENIHSKNTFLNGQKRTKFTGGFNDSNLLWKKGRIWDAEPRRPLQMVIANISHFVDTEPTRKTMNCKGFCSKSKEINHKPKELLLKSSPL